MNPKEEMAGITLSLHAKQPKRATLSYDRAYIEIFEYPRASEAVITWTEDGRKEVLWEGDTKMALSYEVSDMEKTILTGEDEPVLHKVCHPVTSFDQKLADLLDDMKETLANANGAGLAAPQVGILRRAALIMDGQGGYIELINPVITWEEGSQDGPEGCLSVPGKWGLVKRPNWVKLRAQDRFGNWFEVEGEELTARCFCHELDHLEGHLYTEKISRFLTEEEMEQM